MSRSKQDERNSFKKVFFKLCKKWKSFNLICKKYIKKFQVWKVQQSCSFFQFLKVAWVEKNIYWGGGGEGYLASLGL